MLLAAILNGQAFSRLFGPVWYRRVASLPDRQADSPSRRFGAVSKGRFEACADGLTHAGN